MCSDSRKRKQLPSLYVMYVLAVLQTSSVGVFTHRKKQFDVQLSFNNVKPVIIRIALTFLSMC